MIDDAKPVMPPELRVTGIGRLMRLMATPITAMHPTTTARASVETTLTMINPIAVPGTAPVTNHRTASRSIACRSRSAVVALNGMARTTMAPGRASGWTMAITGADSRLSPKPMDPWTVAPTSTATAAIR